MPDIPGSSRAPSKTSGATEVGVGEGEAKNPFPFTCQPCRHSLCFLFIQNKKALPCQGRLPCMVGRQALQTGVHGRRGHSQGAFALPSLRPQRWQQMVGGSSHSRSLFVQALPVQTFLPATERSFVRSRRLLATLLSLGPSQAVYKQGPSRLSTGHQHPQARCPRGGVALASPFPACLGPSPIVFISTSAAAPQDLPPAGVVVACPLQFIERPPCVPLPPSLLRRGRGRSGRSGPRNSYFTVARSLLAIRRHLLFFLTKLKQ